MTPLDALKRAGGRAKFSDRSKKMNRNNSPRWVAFVNVYGHDVAGEGETKPLAIAAALRELPPNLLRHFLDAL